MIMFLYFLVAIVLFVAFSVPASHLIVIAGGVLFAQIYVWKRQDK